MSEAGPTGQQPTQPATAGGTFASGSAVIPEAAIAPAKARHRAGAMPIVLASVALVVAAASLAAAFLFRAQATELQGQVETLRSQQAEASAQQASMNAKLSDLTGQVGELEAATGESLSTYLSGLRSDVASAEAAAQDAYFLAEEASRRTDRFVQCVNSYMKTVGDSGGGYYRYTYCQ